MTWTSLKPMWPRPSRGKILHGLGFNKAMQNKMTKNFSSGWRMRIALAKVLFLRP